MQFLTFSNYIPLIFLSYTLANLNSNPKVRSNAVTDNRRNNLILSSQKYKDSLLENLLQNQDYIPFLQGLYFPTLTKETSQEKSTQVPDNISENGEPTILEDQMIKALFPLEPNAVRDLVELEHILYEDMKTYMKQAMKTVRLVKNYIQDYEESLLGESIKIPVTIEQADSVGNPVIAYRMIRRFAFDMNDILKSLKTHTDQDFLAALNSVKEDMILPDKSDHILAIMSILRVQHYTSLNPFELANGRFGHLQTRTSLQPLHALEIGLQARAGGHLTIAIEWLETALELFGNNTNTSIMYGDQVLVHLINEELLKTVQLHDKNWEDNNHHTNKNYFTEKVQNNLGLKRNLGRTSTYNYERKQSINYHKENNYSHLQRNFINLCSGANFQTDQERSRLYCWYEKEKSPYLVINPMKLELLNENPPLLRIYDFIGPKLIKKLIRTASPMLERSVVASKNAEGKVEKEYFSNGRTSSQAWLNENHYRFLNKMELNIEAVTGLEVKRLPCSQPFQIASYGTSHHFDAHMDEVAVLEKTTPEEFLLTRVATFMIYLSNVDVGGFTAFPALGIVTTPIPGSALFWYNLKRNGQPDFRTTHGGCPVVHGIKWVANKWVTSECSWNRRLCTLHRDE